MASTYNTVAGFIQFDVSERKAAGQDVRDILVQAIGSGGQKVKITVWPENGDVELAKGYFVVAQGKFEESKVSGKTYYNLSSTDILSFPPTAKTERATKALEVEGAVEDDEDEDLLF